MLRMRRWFMVSPCGLRLSPFDVDAVSSRRQYRFLRITIAAAYAPRLLRCVARFDSAAAFRSPPSHSRSGRGPLSVTESKNAPAQSSRPTPDGW